MTVVRKRDVADLGINRSIAFSYMKKTGLEDVD
jgi:hypothetical protein